jgi:hypothetical protein
MRPLVKSAAIVCRCLPLIPDLNLGMKIEGNKRASSTFFLLCWPLPLFRRFFFRYGHHGPVFSSCFGGSASFRQCLFGDLRPASHLVLSENCKRSAYCKSGDKNRRGKKQRKKTANVASSAVVQSRSLMDDQEITAQQFLPGLIDSRQSQLFEAKIAGKGIYYCDDIYSMCTCSFRIAFSQPSVILSDSGIHHG